MRHLNVLMPLDKDILRADRRGVDAVSYRNRPRPRAVRSRMMRLAPAAPGRKGERPIALRYIRLAGRGSKFHSRHHVQTPSTCEVRAVRRRQKQRRTLPACREDTFVRCGSERTLPHLRWIRADRGELEPPTP